MNNEFKDLIKQARDLDQKLLTKYGLRINISREFKNTLEEGGHEHRHLYFNPQNVDLRDGAVRYLQSFRIVYVKNEENGLFLDERIVEQDIIKKVRDVSEVFLRRS